MKIITLRSIELVKGSLPKGLTLTLKSASKDGSSVYVFESEGTVYRFYISKKRFQNRLNIDYKIVEEDMNGKFIKRNDFMIGTVHKITGVVSFAAQPKIHKTEAEAVAEARRLAVACPEKKFMVVEVKAVARTTDVIVE